MTRAQRRERHGVGDPGAGALRPPTGGGATAAGMGDGLRLAGVLGYHVRGSISSAL